MKKKQKSGISLIVLVITIIVIIILAVAVILSIANNNPIENANKARFQNDLKTMQEELELIKQKNYVESQGKDYGILDFDTLKGHEKYSGKFTIKEGKLVYTNLSEKEQEWAEEIGITAGGYVLKNESDEVTIDNGILNTKWYNSDTNTATVPEGVGTDIIIPSSVTTIGEGAFTKCSSLTSITIPNSVTTIGQESFCGCTSLKSVTIPNSVKSMGNSAFSDCNSLISISMPDSFDFLGDGAFANCTSLTEVTIPNIKEGGVSMVGGCTALTKVTIPDTVKYIASEMFYGCTALTNITIPNSIKSIYGSAFADCTSLTSINIPNSVTYIGTDAFYGCSKLTSITLEKESPLDPANAADWGVDTTKCTVTKES